MINKQSKNRQINHKTMRVIVGLIALFLSPAVYLFSDVKTGFDSISFSYWTDSRDIFVGSLFAIAFFLAAYNGSENKKNFEYYATKLSSLFAILVALFPTASPGNKLLPANWVTAVYEFTKIKVIHIHYGAAIILFAYLNYMMWIFSYSAAKKGKVRRSFFYRVISILMTGGIIVIYFFGEQINSEYKILVLEVWALTLFSIGWLSAGLYKTEPDLDNQKNKPDTPFTAPGIESNFLHDHQR